MAYADWSSIHSDWHNYEDTFSADGNEFFVRLSNNDQVVSLTVNSVSAIAGLGECGEVNQYRLCFDNISDDRNIDIDDKGQLRPGIRISVLKNNEEFPVVESSYELPNSLNLNSVHNVSINFFNVNNLSVDSAEFNLDTSLLNIIDSSMPFSEHNILYEFSMPAGTLNESHYIIFEASEVGVDEVRELLRFSEDSDFRESRDMYSVEIINQYDLNVRKENQTIQVNFSNNIDDDVTLKLVDYDDAAFNLSFDDFVVEDNIFTSFNVTQISTGKDNLTLIFEVNVLENVFTESFAFEFENVMQEDLSNNNDNETLQNNQTQTNNTEEPQINETNTTVEEEVNNEENVGAWQRFMNWLQGILS